jgi:hypothetical protein
MLVSFPQTTHLGAPNGMAGSKLPYVFTHTMPVLIEWATRSVLPTSRVHDQATGFFNV